MIAKMSSIMSKQTSNRHQFSLDFKLRLLKEYYSNDNSKYSVRKNME